MYVTYDGEADAMYISLYDDGETRELKTQAVKDWLLIDFDNEGKVCGFEILDVTKHSPFEAVGSHELRFIDLGSPEGQKYLAKKAGIKAR